MPARTLSLIRIHGIDIRLDPSLALIFLLVVYSLGAGLFPNWHPDWPSALAWGTALTAGVLFFSSLLAHELAHSIVAQLHGIRVPRITLFVFGGVSELESEPQAPKTEFKIAIVGPLTSLLLGVLFSAIGGQLAGDAFVETLQTDPGSAMAGLDPAATLFLWLGPVNVMLAIFNLIPGFPLDGGRVLRAAVWWITGDLRRATEWASRAGRGFAWALMGLGIWEALGGGLVQGLWLMLIGWFLNNAARGSYTQLLLSQAMEALSVADLMRTRFESIDAASPLQAFIEDKLLRSDQIAWPVLRDGQPVGLIGLGSIRVALQSGRPPQAVGDAMSRIDVTTRPSVRGREALRLLVESHNDPIPVMESGQIVGLLFHADLTRWLAVHEIETRHGLRS